MASQHSSFRSHMRSSSIHQKAAIFAIRRRARASVLFLFALVVVAYITIFRLDGDGLFSAHSHDGEARGIGNRFLSVKDLGSRWRSGQDGDSDSDDPLAAVGQPVGVKPEAAEEQKVVLDVKVPLADRKAVDVDETKQKPLKAAPAPDAELKVRMAAHTYRDDGLLSLNPDGAHPIYELVARAEKDWAEKQKRASKSLQQAVEEYVRRYGRQPPAGFDRWWKYVRTHNVQLPDEYDRIHHDLEPFWAIDPHILQAAQSARENDLESYTIGKLAPDGGLNMVADWISADDHAAALKRGPEAYMELLAAVEKDLPVFKATFSAEKRPNVLIASDFVERAREAARAGQLLKPSDLPDKSRSGWAGACPSDSLLGQENGLRGTPLEKTFIHDHAAAKDVCAHPGHLGAHSEFLRHATEPNPKIPRLPEKVSEGQRADRLLAPLFSESKTSLHSDILVAPVHLGPVTSADLLPWDRKSDDRLLWRGTPTGLVHSANTPWREAQRGRLMLVTSHTAREVMRILPPTTRSVGQKVGRGKEHKRNKVNAGLMDVAFVGDSGCEGKTCEEMKRELRYKPWMSDEGAAEYKYILDIDGDSASTRFRRMMAGNSIIFKSTVYPEWFDDRVQPWVHFVPVQVDLSDLHDNLVFFGGDISGARGHTAMAKKIASAGKIWTERYWRREDIVAYNFRLFLEYARVMSADRENMNYVLPTTMKEKR